MKKFILSVALVTISFMSANAQIWSTNSSCSRSTYGGSNTNISVRYQRGYTRSNGTYVSGHMKTNSNRTNHDNFSTSQNTNPYTGSIGSRARDYSTQSYNYGNGHTIHTGSRGGQYYINSRGNKTYVPKRRY